MTSSKRDVSSCTLCGQSSSLFLDVNDKRSGHKIYWKCPECSLIFLDPSQRPDYQSEKARYDLHNNDPQDTKYRDFLKPLVGPMAERLFPGAQGLDFGCGPGLALAALFADRGFTVKNYDPIYFPHDALLKDTYDFIVCTEVVEHLHQPQKEFALLKRMLKSGGLLGIMTQVLSDEKSFADWWYRHDSTHVSFYQPSTFEKIAERIGWEITFFSGNIVIFKNT